MKPLKVRAFVNKDGDGGNAAGVVLNADSLSGPERQAIAKKLGYSETAFHSVLGGLDELEFYTPLKRIDVCGHATIATFGVLSMSRKEGIYPVRISGDILQVEIKGHRIGLQISFRDSAQASNEELNEVKTMLTGIDASSIRQASTVNAGVSFLVIEIDTLKSLNKIKPNQKEIKKFCEVNQLVGFYLYARDPKKEKLYYTRMFAPAYGIPEESATGMGSACLMGLMNLQKKQNEIEVIQGLGMTPPAPSELEVTQRGKEIWVYGSFLIEELD